MLSSLKLLSMPSKIIIAVALLLSMTAIVKGCISSIEDRGAAKLETKLKDDDSETLKEKAKNDAEIRKLDDDDLINELTGGVQPKP